MFAKPPLCRILLGTLPREDLTKEPWGQLQPPPPPEKAKTGRLATDRRRHVVIRTTSRRSATCYQKCTQYCNARWLITGTLLC